MDVGRPNHYERPLTDIQRLEGRGLPGNVVPFPVEQNQGRDTQALDANVQVSLHALRNLPKEDVEHGRKVDALESDQIYTKKNYPKEYKCWDNMKQRCKNGKGVLDPRFKKIYSFMTFMGRMPAAGMSVDRKDCTNPAYSPDNCRWASKTTQTRNRHTTRMLTDDSGRCLPVAEWAEEVGLPPKTILARSARGWPPHLAIHSPKGHRLQARRDNNLPYASSEEIETLFVKKMRENHNQGFVPIRAKEKKMLNEIARHLEKGRIPALPALAAVLDSWTGFTSYADKQYGAFNPPKVPTPQYLSRALAAIGNFYLRKLQDQKDEEERKERQTLQREQQIRAEQEREQYAAFVNEYMNTNPTYKRLKDKLAWLESVKTKPNWGMEREHLVEYASSWWMEMEPWGDPPPADTPELWAEGVLKNGDRGNHLGRVWNQLWINTDEEFKGFLRESNLEGQAHEAFKQQTEIIDKL